jgi:uncharacterized protein (TIGR02246 family)
MKRTVLAAIAAVWFLSLLAGSAVSATSPALTAARRAIDAGNRRYLSALEAGDARAFASLYALDGIQMPSSGTPIVRGRAAIAAQTANDLKSTKYLDGRIVTTNVAVFGDRAYETGRYSFTYREAGKQSAKLTGRYFVVWARQPNGSYLIQTDSGFPRACPSR